MSGLTKDHSVATVRVVQRGLGWRAGWAETAGETVARENARGRDSLVLSVVLTVGSGIVALGYGASVVGGRGASVALGLNALLGWVITGRQVVRVRRALRKRFERTFTWAETPAVGVESARAWTGRLRDELEGAH